MTHRAGSRRGRRGFLSDLGLYEVIYGMLKEASVALDWVLSESEDNPVTGYLNFYLGSGGLGQN